mgnify:FL=1
MSETIMISKEEYNLLKNKSDLFDHFVETEELSKEELDGIKKALKGPFLTKSEFLKRHKDI